MIRTFVQVASAGLTVTSAFFLLKVNLGLSPKTLAELASTKWGHNLEVARSLCRQWADTWVGLALLLLAFAFQLWNLNWPFRYQDFEVSRAGLAAALGFTGGALVVGLCLGRKLAEGRQQKVERYFRAPSTGSQE